jgi:hypothetical protein
VVVGVEVVAAELEAALITVAPTAPPAIEPTTIAAAKPRRMGDMRMLLSSLAVRTGA